ncbi:hypothetical protein Pa204_001 [Pseudomonas phage Pa204]|uniref:Uncharacterized protein n=1 Tax=Pseudomonas phage Pa204 TaxID=2590838 RepID=A0A5P1KV71_9CAUD|nr:hypothetical protein Pa204_001 [Pseudomonas phage Pa204]
MAGDDGDECLDRMLNRMLEICPAERFCRAPKFPVPFVEFWCLPLSPPWCCRDPWIGSPEVSGDPAASWLESEI